MKRQARWSSWIVAVTILLAGCANVNVGMPGHLGAITNIAMQTAPKVFQAARPINDSEEYYVGRAVAARILSNYPLHQDPKLTEYVNLVGQTVARKSSRPSTFRGFHFAVLDTTELNAFACPGGTIFITLGLIRTCETEEQLAAVLAHEVSHVAHKDGINSISQSRWTEVLTTMGTTAAKQYGGAAGELVTLFEGSIDDVFKTIVVNGYSRSAEEAADAEALSTLTAAGYNSSAMVGLLAKMMTTDRGGTGISKTHPPTSDRLSLVRAKVTETPPLEMEQVRARRFKEAL
jgi:beta-barrel assembly-enhancing protease